MLNSAYAGVRGRGRYLAPSSTVHEQTQSNRACNILQFCRAGLSLWILFFSISMMHLRMYMFLMHCQELNAIDRNIRRTNGSKKNIMQTYQIINEIEYHIR
jgi:hypothetical protein